MMLSWYLGRMAIASGSVAWLMVASAGVAAAEVASAGAASAGGASAGVALAGVDAIAEARAALAEGDAGLALAWLALAGAAAERSEALTLSVAAHARSRGGCQAAWAAVQRHRERCRAATCTADGAHLDAIERRCLVDLPAFTGPVAVEFDVVAAPGRVLAGARRATLTWVDGTRRARAMCLEPGEPTHFSADADDPRLVPSRGAKAARARAHHLAAVAHGRDGRSCEAAMEFAAARALMPGPATHYNAALAHQRAGDPCDVTLAAFAALAAESPHPLATQAEGEHAAARVRCTATLRVVSGVEGAAITIDGMPPPPDGIVMAGVHRVEVSARGHASAMTLVSLGGGEARTVSLDPPRSHPMIGWAPPAESPPDVQPDDSLGWLWAPLVATGVGLAVGGTFTALADADIDDFDALLRDAAADPTRSYRAEADETLAAFDRNRAWAIAGFGLAAAGAATFAIGWFINDPSTLAPTATTVGPGLSGRF